VTAAALVVELRSRGVTLEPRGDKLAVRPVQLVTPEELEALRIRKAEVLALLTVNPWRPPALAPRTVAEVLGPTPDPADLAVVEQHVAAELAGLRFEIQSGRLVSRPRAVWGRPLGDWLDLDTVAALLRGWEGRPCR
jgi:hypothetical protein